MRLIDADEVFCSDCEWKDQCENVVCDVKTMPTIDPESLRPQGEWSECDWVEYDGHGECIHHPKAGLRCSNCCNAFKKELLWKDNYCPNCGAYMKGAGEDA